jgi:hypothetical protein
MLPVSGVQYLLLVVAYEQGVSSFLLHCKMASNLPSVQESLFAPIKLNALIACIIVAVGFTLPLLACARRDLQDLITQISCACACFGAMVPLPTSPSVLSINGIYGFV